MVTTLSMTTLPIHTCLLVITLDVSEYLRFLSGVGLSLEYPYQGCHILRFKPHRIYNYAARCLTGRIPISLNAMNLVRYTLMAVYSVLPDRREAPFVCAVGLRRRSAPFSEMGGPTAANGLTDLAPPARRHRCRDRSCTIRTSRPCGWANAEDAV